SKETEARFHIHISDRNRTARYKHGSRVPRTLRPRYRTAAVDTASRTATYSFLVQPPHLQQPAPFRSDWEESCEKALEKRGMPGRPSEESLPRNSPSYELRDGHKGIARPAHSPLDRN